MPMKPFQEGRISKCHRPKRDDEGAGQQGWQGGTRREQSCRMTQKSAVADLIAVNN